MTSYTTINRTRRGYSYQDKYALFHALIDLRDGKLEHLVVDHTFEGNLSVDIELMRVNPREITICEVKTGERFKSNRFKELGHALKTLYRYDELHRVGSSVPVNIKLIVSPILKAEILQHWTDLLFIKDGGNRSRLRERSYQVIVREYVGKMAEVGWVVSEDNFVEFVKRLELVSELKDERVGNQENDNYSPLEDAILAEIDNIARKITCVGGSDIITSHDIYLELLDVIRSSSEGMGDCKNVLVDTLVKALAKRSAVADLMSTSRTITDQLLTDCEGTVRQRINKMCNQPSTVGNPQTSSGEIAEVEH